ncbi:MAG: GNAT family N-acetyltransferase [Chloroflexi bacterium]|nr:GNAT family N-acetyltransferase [Chloroflexota bacterium]
MEHLLQPGSGGNSQIATAICPNIRRMEQATIEQLKKVEIRETARLLALAFSTRPGLIKILKGQRDKECRAIAMFEFSLKHQPGNTLAAKKDNRIVGVIRFVEWPHCQLSPLQLLRFFPTMLVEMRSTALHYARQGLTWYRLDPKQPHWHIDPIAVIPEMHRQGIGSQLLTCFCKQMDEKGDRAYLETDKPEYVRLYGRFGFEVTGEADVHSRHFWFMWRKPRGKSANQP